jgi:hypothetical protein
MLHVECVPLGDVVHEHYTLISPGISLTYNCCQMGLTKTTLHRFHYCPKAQIAWNLWVIYTLLSLEDCSNQRFLARPALATMPPWD